jgi:hypothetical protein
LSAPEQLAPPPRPLFDVLTGTWISQVGYAVAELGVADHLSDQPRHIDEVAAEVGAHPDALYRVMRALAASGVFVEASPRHFVLNPPGQALASGSPFAHFLQINGSEHIRLLAEMLHTVRTGEPAANRAYGMHFFDHLTQDPAAHRAFLGSHAPAAHRAAAAVLSSCDLSTTRTIVDVGGGDGGLLCRTLGDHPHLRGILFDLPETLPLAEERIRAAGLAGRCELVGGSFFDAVPACADVYVIAHCLHNWNDDDALSILRTVRSGMPEHGRLIVLERFVAAGPGYHPSKVMDLLMLLIGGRERTRDEYYDLLVKAGFDVQMVRSLTMPGLPTDNAFEARTAS